MSAGGARRTVSSAARTRTVSASVPDVWLLIEDPYQMPRWWPGVERMESVEGERFTQVFRTKRRHTVRADFRLLTSEPPRGDTSPGRRSWAQELAGTPFERVLREAVTEVVVEPAKAGTRVTIAQRQRLRGFSRTGALAMRRAIARRLDEALDGLERIFG